MINYKKQELASGAKAYMFSYGTIACCLIIQPISDKLKEYTPGPNDEFAEVYIRPMPIHKAILFATDGKNIVLPDLTITPEFVKDSIQNVLIVAGDLGIKRLNEKYQ